MMPAVSAPKSSWARATIASLVGTTPWRPNPSEIIVPSGSRAPMRMFAPPPRIRNPMIVFRVPVTTSGKDARATSRPISANRPTRNEALERISCRNSRTAISSSYPSPRSPPTVCIPARPADVSRLELFDRLLRPLVALLTVPAVLHDHRLGGGPLQPFGQLRGREDEIRLLAPGGAGVGDVQHVVHSGGVEGGTEPGLEDGAGAEAHPANREH